MDLATVQMWGFAFIIGGALSLIILERLYPYNPGQKIFREGFWLDLIGYGLVQSYVLGMAISALIEWIDRTGQFSRAQIVTHWPLWVQCVFFLGLHDLYIYSFHRTQHKFPFLWRTHEAHHGTDDVDWLSGARSHPLEIMINQTIEFAPIVLLGASPAVPVIKGALSAVWGMYIHSNIRVSPDRPLTRAVQKVINGPGMHRWHHAICDERAMNKNFGTKLAIWDWLFGTAFFPSDSTAKKFGLGDPNFPQTYVGQTMYAFRQEKAQSDEASSKAALSAG